MMLQLHFRTELGARTVVVEIGDSATARAIANAHLALGEMASVTEETSRISLKAHMAAHKKRAAKAAKLVVVPRAVNVTPLRKVRS